MSNPTEAVRTTLLVFLLMSVAVCVNLVFA